jgi:outer membrane protein assembly factor BamB
MGKRIVVTVFSAALATTAAGGAYLGSVVNSWDANYSVGPVGYGPIGLCFGDGYIWVCYDGFFTKRNPANGAVVDVLSFSGYSGQDLGYENATGYLYFGTGAPYVYVRSSATGETIRTFNCPPAVPDATGLDFDDSHPSNPIWLSDENAPTIWNLTSTGSVITSLALPFGGIEGIAYASGVAGGPYLFAGARSTSTVYALAPTSGSIIYSFQGPPTAPGLSALGYDGEYLWTLDIGNFSPTRGYAFQFVAYGDFTAVTPASWGRVKALYR